MEIGCSTTKRLVVKVGSAGDHGKRTPIHVTRSHSTCGLHPHSDLDEARACAPGVAQNSEAARPGSACRHSPSLLRRRRRHLAHALLPPFPGAPWPKETPGETNPRRFVHARNTHQRSGDCSNLHRLRWNPVRQTLGDRRHHAGHRWRDGRRRKPWRNAGHGRRDSSGQRQFDRSNRGRRCSWDSDREFRSRREWHGAWRVHPPRQRWRQWGWRQRSRREPWGQ